MEIFWRYKLVIKITNGSLNKLQSYCPISALGPAGHCTSCFMLTASGCPQGGGGSSPCGRMWTRGGGQNPDFFVDIINGWPHTITAAS